MSASGSTTSATTIGGVATAKGFRAAGISAGIKATKKLDLALVVSETPATAAAMFTQNKVQAAPVLVCKDHLQKSGGVVRAIVVNSGCANACTGDQGMADAHAMAAETARLVGCPVEQVLVASTGVIGVNLPMDRLRSGIPQAFAALSGSQGPQAAQAIMTTDPFPKESCTTIMIGGKTVTIGGMAKGSGMIGPDMAPAAPHAPHATMLAFVTTDAAVPQPLLSRALAEVAEDTFNAITVDGDTSTNDAVMLLANGASGATIGDAEYASFAKALRSVCLELALGIVRGGEGATKLVTVTVSGAASADEARRTAKAIANSLLVKTAIHGGDPNWGRLIAVAGRAGVAFNPSRAKVTIGPNVLFDNGRPHDERAADAAEYLKRKELAISVDLGAGSAVSTVYTCDLSAEYVRINAEYRT
jgi:glutamate N-acetyltransferase/amino-acid N-acetyltransferase